MKKWVLLALLVLAMAIYAWGESYQENRSWTTSFVCLGGDSTNHTYTETSYVELNLPTAKYRFNKLQYQADAAFGSMAACTLWVQLQQGPGSHVAPYDTLQSFVITGDSLYSTTGWDLIYTWLADSAKPDVRVRVIVQTDSTGNAPVSAYDDSTFTLTHTIDAWGHD